MRACALGLGGPASSVTNPSKAYLKLGIAYVEAADLRSALSCFETAQRHLAPTDLLHVLSSIETARAEIKLAKACDYNRVGRNLVRVATMLLGAADARNAFLFSDCCTLLAEIQIQKRNLASAQFWLRRAISIQTDIGPPGTLAATLRTLSKLLVERERYLEAREVLRGADTILSDCESDQGVQAVVRAELATIDIALGERAAAREKLRMAVRTLRQRSHADPQLKPDLVRAAATLCDILSPTHRLKRKTACEEVQHRTVPME